MQHAQSKQLRAELTPVGASTGDVGGAAVVGTGVVGAPVVGAGVTGEEVVGEEDLGPASEWVGGRAGGWLRR